MMLQEQVAPSYARLRPMKAPQDDGFPVYHGLVDHLADAGPVPDEIVRHVLGVCAGYSYSDGATVATIMARLGLEENRCVTVSESVDAMFIESTAHVVQSNDGRVVILSYRGTEPANAINWLTDGDVSPDRLRLPEWQDATGAEVHGGFYRNVRATRASVIEVLQRALEGHDIAAEVAEPIDLAAEPPIDLAAPPPMQPMETLYVTGHSLGGAMAALMMLMVLQDSRYAALKDRLRMVCTYGQPMVGNAALAEAYDRLPAADQRLYRYVYEHDLVPQLPPKESGDFRHFGQEFQYEKAKGKPGDWRHNARPIPQVGNIFEIVGALGAFVARTLRITRDVTFRASLDDHGPQHYITALQPDGVLSEYGD